MTRKDYEKAANIARRYWKVTYDVPRNSDAYNVAFMNAMMVTGAYAELFRSEPKFDEQRFRRECENIGKLQ